MTYNIRDIYKTQDGRSVRIIDNFNDSNIQRIVTIDVNDKGAQPQVWTPQEIREIAKEHGWRKWSPSSIALTSRKDVSAKANALRQERWNIAKDFSKDKRFYCQKTRSVAVSEWADKYGKSSAFIRKLLRLYYQGGMTPASLETKFHKCGRQAFDGKPRGRKPRYLVYEPFTWNEQEYKKAVDFCRKLYLEDINVSYAEVHLKLLAKHYTYVDAEGNTKQLEPGHRPSLRQVETLLRKNTTLKERRESRLSLADHHNNEAAKLGTALDDCGGPGDVYEIDASQVDLWLVSPLNRGIAIGKATMYLIVDRFSRLIVAFYISLDPPSWSSARQAILAICEDKEALCLKHGVKYDPEDWPAHGLLPARFFGDNGEMASQESTLISDELGLELTNAPALFSSSKGSVECTFKLVHVPFKRLRAGWEPARNVKRRRGKKYLEDAKLDLNELKGRFLKVVIEHNKRVHEGYQLSPQDIMNGYLPIPLDIFKRGVESQLGLGRSFDEQEVRMALLEKGQGVVHQVGIRVGHLYYTCPEAEAEGWFAQAAVHGAFKVDVRVDAGLVNHIYVFDRLEKTKYYRASLTSKLQDFNGLSRAEVDQVMYLYMKNIAIGKELDLGRAIEQMYADAQAGLLEHGPKAKRSKTNSPVARRQAQLQARSEDKAFPPTSGSLDVIDVEARVVSSEPDKPPLDVTPSQQTQTSAIPNLPEQAAVRRDISNRLLPNDNDLE